MRNTAILAAALLLPATVLAQGNEISYSYLDLGYLAANIDVADSADLDASGISLGGSVEVGDRGHLFARYERAELDDAEAVDFDERVFGGGVQFALFDALSVYGRFGLADVNVDADIGFGEFSASDDGIYAAGGARYLLLDTLELRGGVEYYDLEDGGDDTFVTLGGEYFLTDVVALTFDVSIHEDAEMLVIGGRIYPGKDSDARRGR